MMKNIPGPRAPPFNRRPNLNITTRSYSCTTLMQKNSDNGKVATNSKIDKLVKKNAQISNDWSEVAGLV